MRTYAQIEREQARRVCLDLLRDQPDGRLSLPLIQTQLRVVFGITRPLEWVEDQLRWLAAMDAVRLHDQGLLIAELLGRGERHLTREALIPGVEAPPRPEA